MPGDAAPTSRRTLLKALAGAAVAMVVAPIAYAVGRFLTARGSAQGAQSVTLRGDILPAAQAARLIELDGEPVIIVREADHGLRAFTATCTHLGCTVSYAPELPGFACRCHGGRFDQNGVNVPGTRPPAPLTELTITEVGGDVTISLTPRRTRTAS